MVAEGGEFGLLAYLVAEPGCELDGGGQTLDRFIRARWRAVRQKQGQLEMTFRISRLELRHQPEVLFRFIETLECNQNTRQEFPRGNPGR
jgi:hypothetical protein